MRGIKERKARRCCHALVILRASTGPQKEILAYLVRASPDLFRLIEDDAQQDGTTGVMALLRARRRRLSKEEEERTSSGKQNAAA